MTREAPDPAPAAPDRNGVTGLRNYLWHVTVIFVGFLLGILWSISWNQTTKNTDQIQQAMQREAVIEERMDGLKETQQVLKQDLNAIRAQLDAIDRKLTK